MVRDARRRAPHHEGLRPHPEEHCGAMRLEGRSHRSGIALEIMPGVRTVEGFVAERKIRDDVALDRRFQQRPLEP